MSNNKLKYDKQKTTWNMKTQTKNRPKEKSTRNAYRHKDTWVCRLGNHIKKMEVII